MILKASQRGGGRQLAVHLMNVADNEHVHVHELRGFVSDDLEGAFQEAYAVSRGTKAKQFLFSLSLNPPPNEKVSASTFEAAIDAAERKLGLSGQPRAIVFHEKDGRRHAHAVWSRIDGESMKAINLPFFKTKLRDVARDLFIENGWQMPRGFVNSKERDQATYSLAEWQQAKRGGHDPKALKAMFQECWATSDSGKAFTAALQARGYTVCRGDRRSFVAIDYRGEVYGIARACNVKTKDVRARLGEADKLPSIEEAKAQIAKRMTGMLEGHIQALEARHKTRSASLAFRRAELVGQQRMEREKLQKEQEARRVKEMQERAKRFRKGLGGLWDRITFKHSKIKKRNALEAQEAEQRDNAERDRLIYRQLDQRRTLHQEIKAARQAHSQRVAELHCDIASFGASKLKEAFAKTQSRTGPERKRGRDLER